MQEQSENVTISPASYNINPNGVWHDEIPAKDESSSAFTAIVQDVIRKRIDRNPRYAGMSVVIDSVNVHYDNNLTVVVVDIGVDQVIGWAKFNPKDVRYISGTSKKGHYWTRKESKYRDMAGIMKAIHRAVDKLLDP